VTVGDHERYAARGFGINWITRAFSLNIENSIIRNDTATDEGGGIYANLIELRNSSVL
jgi:predicted outer membrane repeat protein